MGFPFGPRSVKTVTIANGASLSDAASPAAGLTLVGVVSPAAWTAAGLAFQVSYDGGTTYVDLYDEAVEYTVTSVTTAAARYHALDYGLFAGATNIKVRSSTAGSAVNQGASRILTLVFRGLA